MNATSRVGMKVTIVRLGGVDGCWPTPSYGVDLLTSERMSDDVQGSASTLRTRSVQRRPLLLVEQSRKVGLRKAEMNSAQGQSAAAIPVGKQAKVANLHESGGQNMEKEAPDELLAIESHGAAVVVVPRVAPAKAHSSVLHADQPSVGDGNPMGVAGQILQHMLGSAERRLGVDHPLLMPEASEQRGEGAR